MMLKYLLRRLLPLPLMLLAASAIIFLLLRLGAGDPALDYLRLSNVPPTSEMIAATREQLGLNQPLALQYLHWLWRALHLDFGVSYASQRPVLEDLLHFLPATLQLTGAALVIILLTSLPLGIWAARHRDRLPDFAVRLIAFLGVSMPNFWLAFLLVMLFSVHLRWLPAMGYGGWRHSAATGVFHRPDVAGDQCPSAARQHAGSVQPAPRGLGASARAERGSGGAATRAA